MGYHGNSADASVTVGSYLFLTSGSSGTLLGFIKDSCQRCQDECYLIDNPVEPTVEPCLLSGQLLGCSGCEDISSSVVLINH